MRLGAQRCPVKSGTLLASIYGDSVYERHRHRFEVNNDYVHRLEAAGLTIAARTPVEGLTETIELPTQGEHAHPWFLGVQFHPEFTSNPRHGHPLFIAYIKAALAHAGEQRRQAAGAEGDAAPGAVAAGVSGSPVSAAGVGSATAATPASAAVSAAAATASGCGCASTAPAQEPAT